MALVQQQQQQLGTLQGLSRFSLLPSSLPTHLHASHVRPRPATPTLSPTRSPHCCRTNTLATANSKHGVCRSSRGTGPGIPGSKLSALQQPPFSWRDGGALGVRTSRPGVSCRGSLVGPGAGWIGGGDGDSRPLQDGKGQEQEGQEGQREQQQAMWSLQEGEQGFEPSKYFLLAGGESDTPLPALPGSARAPIVGELPASRYRRGKYPQLAAAAAAAGQGGFQLGQGGVQTEWVEGESGMSNESAAELLNQLRQQQQQQQEQNQGSRDGGMSGGPAASNTSFVAMSEGDARGIILRAAMGTGWTTVTGMAGPSTLPDFPSPFQPGAFPPASARSSSSSESGVGWGLPSQPGDVQGQQQKSEAWEPALGWALGASSSSSSSVGAGGIVSSSSGCGGSKEEEELWPVELSKSPRRTARVKFTCNKCGARTMRAINPHAYGQGTVFVQCGGCLVFHKLVDHLNLFHEFSGEVFRGADAGADGFATHESVDVLGVNDDLGWPHAPFF